LCYEHLFKVLVDKLGFAQSDHDPCLLTKPCMIFKVFVNNAGIGCKDKKEADALVQQLLDHGFELTREGSSEFLGIKFDKDENTGTVNRTQKDLIKKIIEITAMVDCNPNWTHASQQGLGSDPDGKTMREDWEYASVVGIFWYLSTNTRPDISFAVSQVARFTHSPKQSHVKAIKTIVRYLHCTSTQGTIVKLIGRLDPD